MRQGLVYAALEQADLLHHMTVREIGKSYSHVVASILMSAAQMVFLIAGFFVMAQLMSFGSSGIRGDLVVYLVTGVFFFQVHVKAMSAVLRADTRDTGVMLHQPMSTPIAITASVLGSLYIQTAAAFVVLLLYHFAWSSISLYQPVALTGTYLLSWASGVAVGLVFLSIKPSAPAIVSLVSQIYSRANMIASGQMFVANALPAAILGWFSWNPLFHVIDQARGYAFLNYTPWNTNVQYPIIMTLVVGIVGLIAERATRGRRR